MSCSRRLTLLSLLLVAPFGRAAAPSLDHLYPIAIPRGATSAVAAIGKFEPWPAKIWVDSPGIVFKPETNAGKFTVEVAAEASPGPHLVRVFNDQGATAPRFLVITETPAIAEQEPNDERGKPQSIADLPAQINGRLDKNNDVDGYRIQLGPGQSLVASLEAYVLMSPVDAVLRLIDHRGVEVALNHDDGRTFDPRLTYVSAHGGAYTLQVFGFAYPADASVRFTGNDKCVYRLHLNHDLPEPRIGQSSVSNQLETPSTVLGCIEVPDEQDEYSFTAKKGEKLRLRVETVAFGLPLDGWLKVLDASGKELARNDDADSADPTLEWSAPEDGKYVAAVGNLLHRGGSNYLYRFALEHPVPAYRPTVSDHGFTVEAGKTNQIKIAVRRTHGHEGKLSVRVIGLPDGVSCAPEETTEKSTEANVRLVADPGAKPFRGPIQIVLTDPQGKEQPVLYRMVSQGENNGVPQGYSRLLIDATEHLWLTVTTK